MLLIFFHCKYFDTLIPGNDIVHIFLYKKMNIQIYRYSWLSIEMYKLIIYNINMDNRL